MVYSLFIVIYTLSPRRFQRPHFYKQPIPNMSEEKSTNNWRFSHNRNEVLFQYRCMLFLSEIRTFGELHGLFISVII